MAHKRHRDNHHPDLSSDDDNSISSHKLLDNLLKPSLPLPSLHLDPPKFKLTEIEDRRVFSPTPRPAKSLQTPNHRLKIAPPAVKRGPGGKPLQSRSLPRGVAFEGPRHILICIRRKMRKEVLFALNRTKRGKGSPRKRSEYSDIKC